MTYPRRQYGYGGWDPFAELQALRAELGRMVGSALMHPRSQAADVDLDETENGWVVTARLPGVAPEEVEVDLEERVLSIRARSEAEVNADLSGEASGSHRRAFEYRMTVPGDVEPDQIDATMDHGLLTIRLPRVSKSQRRQITIGRRPAEQNNGGGGTTGQGGAQGTDESTG
jgi:HSP20 family protein